MMPYQNKEKDRRWHRLAMRKRRAVLKAVNRNVTPGVTPKLDADGNLLPDYDRD